MQNLRINPGPLPSTIHVPTSKSYANRALILSALKSGKMTLHNVPKASDVTFLIDGLKKIGLQIEIHGSSATILNEFPACEIPSGSEIYIGEGGTTGRFLACLLALGHAPYTLILGPRLKERPWIEFVSLINQMGATARLHENRLFIQGPVRFPDLLEIDCSQTSQIASGFQLATAFTKVSVVPKNLETSLSYWKMTQEMVQQFKNKTEYNIPLDWSSASYPLVFGAIKQEIHFPDLKPDPFQADSKLFEILKKLNAIKETSNGIQTIPNTTRMNLEVDASDCLDLVPALVFLMCHVQGEHRLFNLENLAYKESDRLTELMKLMTALGFNYSLDGSTLKIDGNLTQSTDEVSLVLADDHRIVMTGALFLRFHKGGWISPARAVEKSFPHFFDLMN
jgi:3-phosphoshikimate 1-carboxyvinyltransferase